MLGTHWEYIGNLVETNWVHIVGTFNCGLHFYILVFNFVQNIWDTNVVLFGTSWGMQ
jgi:hypothetical protein